MKSNFLKSSAVILIICIITFIFGSCAADEAPVPSPPPNPMSELPRVTTPTPDPESVDVSASENIDETEAEIVPEFNQPLSFAGSESMPEANRIWAQEMLNDLGPAPEGSISINGFNAWYNDDGSLVVEAFVRNGYERNMYIQQIELTIVIVDNNENERVVASAFFGGFPFGTILPTQSVGWAFTFPHEQVLIHDADLSSYILRFTYSYR